jgi:hypothetical protein
MYENMNCLNKNMHYLDRVRGAFLLYGIIIHGK